MFDLRKSEPADAAAINELYRIRTGRNRPMSFYDWEWRDGPLGPAPSWVICERSTGRVAAHHGVIPIALEFRGKALRAARTENTMIDPVFSGKFVYHAFEAIALRQLHTEYEILFTTAGKGAPAAVRRRLGYKPVAQWHSHTTGLNFGHPARRVVGPAGSFFDRFGLVGPPARRVGWSLEEISNLGIVENLWRTCAVNFELAPSRSAAWLEWRFARNPYHRFRFLLLKRHGCPTGFAAIRQQEIVGGAIDMQIDDLFVADNIPDDYSAALALIADSYRTSPARLILRTLANGSPLAVAAAAAVPAGLAQEIADDGASFLALAPEHTGARDWHISMAVAQGQ